MTKLIDREPVATAGLARVLVAVAGRYGLEFSVEELLLLMGAAEVLITMFTRSRVSPVPNA